MQDDVNALESYGWAARSMRFRSAAYAKMAQIYLANHSFDQCLTYCRKALHFNQSSVNALQTQLILAHHTGNENLLSSSMKQLLEVDPINHLAHWIRSNKLAHQSELPEQTYLELALIFYNHNLLHKALQVLEEAPDSWLIQLWKDKLDNTSFDN